MKKMESPFKPTKQQILASVGKTIPDVIAPDLHVLFCGINPGLYSGAVGHHFARPGNRFWPALFAAGITDRLLSAFEECELLQGGYGITNLVERATATADGVSREELINGARRLQIKAKRYKPRIIAVVGIGAYRTAFARPKAGLGLQAERISESEIWVLPNPSGLNAHYKPKELAELYQELRIKVDQMICDDRAAHAEDLYR